MKKTVLTIACGVALVGVTSIAQNNSSAGRDWAYHQGDAGGASIDGYFRAFDARNGEELWRDKLPTPSQGTPTTYQGRDGKQYVVVGANGGGFFGAPTADDVIAYVLP